MINNKFSFHKLEFSFQNEALVKLQFLETFHWRSFPGGEGVGPRVLVSTLGLALDSDRLRPALGIPPRNFRIFATLFKSDSFLCPELGLESEKDFDNVSKRAVERKIN